MRAPTWAVLAATVVAMNGIRQGRSINRSTVIDSQVKVTGDQHENNTENDSADTPLLQLSPKDKGTPGTPDPTRAKIIETVLNGQLDDSESPATQKGNQTQGVAFDQPGNKETHDANSSLLSPSSNGNGTSSARNSESSDIISTAPNDQLGDSKSTDKSKDSLADVSGVQGEETTRTDAAKSPLLGQNTNDEAPSSAPSSDDSDIPKTSAASGVDQQQIILIEGDSLDSEKGVEESRGFCSWLWSWPRRFKAWITANPKRSLAICILGVAGISICIGIGIGRASWDATDTTDQPDILTTTMEMLNDMIEANELLIPPGTNEPVVCIQKIQVSPSTNGEWLTIERHGTTEGEFTELCNQIQDGTFRCFENRLAVECKQRLSSGTMPKLGYSCHHFLWVWVEAAKRNTTLLYQTFTPWHSRYENVEFCGSLNPSLDKCLEDRSRG